MAAAWTPEEKCGVLRASHQKKLEALAAATKATGFENPLTNYKATRKGRSSQYTLIQYRFVCACGRKAAQKCIRSDVRRGETREDGWAAGGWGERGGG
jgi:hypothetical protein